MDPLFSGSIARQRQINLGGRLPGPSSSSQLAEQARSARLARDQLRKSHQAATTIQKHWRGTQVRSDIRKQNQQRFIESVSSTSLALQSPSSISSTSRLLIDGIRIYNPSRENNRAARYRGKDAPAEDELLKQWCQTLITPSQANQATPLHTLLQTVSPGRPSAWQAVLALSQEVEWRLKLHADKLPQDTQAVYLTFLQSIWTRNIHIPSNAQSEPAGLSLIGQYRAVADVVAALPSGKGKVSAALADATVNAILCPFTFTSGDQHAAERDLCVVQLAVTMLQSPSFRSLPVVHLGRLGANLPIIDLATFFVQKAKPVADVKGSSDPRFNWQLAYDNFATLCNHKLAKYTSGKEVALHLDALAALQYAAATTATPASAKTSTTRKTTVPKDLPVALAASNKYPASTRPALYRYLLGLLADADPLQGSQIANAVLYGSNSSSSSSNQARGGPMREIWRGYIRGSPLARDLSKVSANAQDSSFLNASEGWEALLLLCELYSRILGTLADDEFMPLDESGNMGPSAAAETSRSDLASLGTSAANATGSTIAARNPLSMDEMLDFAAIVRNLAFGSYWHIDAPSNDSKSHNDSSRKTTLDRPHRVVYTYSKIRDLSTRLAQQLHTRDTRHRFTPDKFWNITAGLDISEYLDWILQEDDRLTEEAEAAENAALDADGDVDMTYDSDPVVSLPTASKSTRISHMSARRLAIASPRLGILNNLPFVIPFHTRVDVFDSFVSRDRERLGIRDNWSPWRGRSIKTTIRRDHIAEDGMEKLNHHGPLLKNVVHVTFVDQFGIQERGIDGGGLFKEFFTSLAREAFDSDRGLWRVNDRQEHYPNPQAFARQSEQLEWYKFLGRIVGKGLYDEILVDLRFAPFFLSKLLGRQEHHFTDDLASLDSLDPELYRGLVYLKNYTGDVENDLSLNFTITDDEFGVSKVSELIPGGTNTPVTRANRLEYIHRVARYRLDYQIRRQSEAFLAGVSDLINPRWLRIFDQVELQELIKGADAPIDIEDLRANTIYSDYHEKDLTIEYFWQSMESFNQETRAAVLKFITSCPSPPLLGFKSLNPKICIRLAGEDEGRLPTSSTCMNLFKLPRYNSYEVCREKILTAVNSGAGFDLE
ncbi:unnamed protein product [Sympodiomycopsis kandeliae]